MILKIIFKINLFLNQKKLNMKGKLIVNCLLGISKSYLADQISMDQYLIGFGQKMNQDSLCVETDNSQLEVNINVSANNEVSLALVVQVKGCRHAS